MPALFTGPSVDPEHPWLGLHPFTEENQHYFFGRTDEIRDIFLRVREQPLTVLYGQSGLGKTSLLRAGLLPKLRVERYRPVRLLLDFGPESPTLIAQARRAFAEALADAEHSVETLLLRWTPLASLWEIFAHEELRPTDLANRPPVLIFDQFEEVFTLGGDALLDAGTGVAATAPSHACRQEVTELIYQLADLVEGRAPGALQQQLAADPRLSLDYDFTPTPVRVVLTLREDYLAQLEDWKSALPALMRNRMPLRLLSGPQALESVVRPGRLEGRALVSDEVGAQIVRFVARREKDTPLTDIEAVPPLVSLLCERLNDARLASTPPLTEINATLVEQQSADILQRFYGESFEAFPENSRAAIRAWVEDRLVTVGGHRNPVAREDALAELGEAGVADPSNVVDRLIARRLLTAERRGGIQRLEITHDVLCPLVVRARKDRHAATAERLEAEAKAAAARQKKQLRRARAIAAGFALLGLLAVVALLVALLALRSADLEKQRAGVEAWHAKLAQAQTLASEQAAQAAKDKAIKAKEAADELTDYIQYDLRKLISGKRWEQINQRILDYHQQYPPADDDSEGLRRKASAVNDRGRIQNDQGEYALALTLYEEALKTVRLALQKDPDNIRLQSNLSAYLANISGSLLKLAQIGGAESYANQSLEVAKKITTLDPSNLKWQRSLASCNVKVGEVLKAQGDLDAALQSFRSGLKVAERLVKEEPKNAESMHALSLCHTEIGDVLLIQRQLDDALKAYRDCLAITERLAKQDPDNTGWQRDLSLSYNNVGDVLRAQGQLPGALQAYQDGLAIAERLAKLDPDNATWQRNLSVSYDNVGDVLRDQGQLPDALKAYRDGLAIRERLARQDPDNATWQRDLSLSYVNVGDVVQQQQRWEEAADAFERAVAIVGPWLLRPNVDVAWLSNFTYAAGSRWEVLRDAPAGEVKIDRAAALADLHIARDRMKKLQEENRLVPPMDKNLPWIEGLLREAETPPKATPRPATPRSKKR